MSSVVEHLDFRLVDIAKKRGFSSPSSKLFKLFESFFILDNSIDFNQDSSLTSSNLVPYLDLVNIVDGMVEFYRLACWLTSSLIVSVLWGRCNGSLRRGIRGRGLWIGMPSWGGWGRGSVVAAHSMWGRLWIKTTHWWVIYHTRKLPKYMTYVWQNQVLL